MNVFWILSLVGIIAVILGCLLILAGQQLENEKMSNIGAVILVVGFCVMVGFGIYGRLRG